MLKTKVKVNKITNLSEARYCAGMGVDFLCFPVTDIDPKTYAEITGWVAGPKFGIEVDRQNLELIQNYEADFIQINYADIDLIPKDKMIIPVIKMSEWDNTKSKLKSFKNQVLFLETISNSEFSEAPITEIKSDFELFIQLSNPGEIDRFLNLSFSGISLEGATEQRPGLKEYPLAEILEKLEVE